MPIQTLTNPVDFASLAAQAITMGAGHTAELILAARRGEIGVLLLKPETPAPMKWLRRATLPTIAVIGDDPGDAGHGPAGWLATRRLVDWAAFAIVHAAGGTVADYRLAVTLTKRHGRLLLIETTSAQQDEWARVLVQAKPRPVPFIGVVACDRPHPITMAGSAAQ